MKRKLMMQQEEKILNFWKKRLRERREMPATATKFTIDSIIENKARILVSKSKRPIRVAIEMLAEPSGELGKQLAKFDLWEEEKDADMIISLKQAAEKLGVKKSLLKEGKVFVNFGNKPFEISEFVREETKNHYIPLLKREYHPIRRQEEKAR